MAYESLQALVGTAVIDPGFRTALLNGTRRSALESFDLTIEEMNAVLAIRAETLAQFASQLHQWILKQQQQVEPPALPLPTRRRGSGSEDPDRAKPARLTSPLPAVLVA